MTDESSSSSESGEVLTGRIAARFVYASRGIDGWGVSGQIGSVTDQVKDEAVSYLERLHSPQGYGSVAEHLRERRLVFAGSPGSPWRFLLNSMAAGADASGRSDNCFSDCLIVQSDKSANGIDPATLWDSASWLKPYGAEEVTAADPRASGGAALRLAGSPVTTLRRLVEFVVEERVAPGYLYAVARMVETLESPAARSAPTWVGVPQLGFAPILLSVLYGLLPFDVAWDASFEIRNAPLNPAGQSPVALRFIDAKLLPGGGNSFTVSPGTSARERRLQPCPTCGRPVTTWSDLLITCLTGLAAMLHEAETREEAASLADSLWRYCAMLRDERVPSSEYPNRFTDDRLPSQFFPLTKLFGAVVSHNHLQPRRYISDPDKVLAFLREHTPSDLTAAVAARQLERVAFPMTAEVRAVLEFHVNAGDPPEAAQGLLERLSSVRTDSWKSISSQPHLVGAVADRLLRAVAILGCTHYDAAPFPRSLNANHIAWALKRAGTGDWGQPIRNLELFDKFLQSWVAVQPGLGEVTRVLTQRDPGGPFAMGYTMMREALKPTDAIEGEYYLKFLEQVRRTPGGLPRATDEAVRDLQIRVRQAFGDGGFGESAVRHA